MSATPDRSYLTNEIADVEAGSVLRGGKNYVTRNGQTYWYDDALDTWILDVSGHKFTADERQLPAALDTEVLANTPAGPRYRPQGIHSFGGRQEGDVPGLKVRFALRADGTPDEQTEPNRREKLAWVASQWKTRIDSETGKISLGERGKHKRAVKQAFRLRKEAEREYIQRMRTWPPELTLPPPVE